MHGLTTSVANDERMKLRYGSPRLARWASAVTQFGLASILALFHHAERLHAAIIRFGDVEEVRANHHFLAHFRQMAELRGHHAADG